MKLSVMMASCLCAGVCFFLACAICRAQRQSPRQVCDSYLRACETATTLDNLAPFLAKGPFSKLPPAFKEFKPMFEMIKKHQAHPSTWRYESIPGWLAEVGYADSDSRAKRTYVLYVVDEGGAWRVSGVRLRHSDAWCAETAKVPFPRKSVYGRIRNIPFKADSVTLSASKLTPGWCDLRLKQRAGPASNSFSINIAKRLPDLVGKTFTSEPGKSELGVVHVSTTEIMAPEERFDGGDGYGMRLSFGQPSGTKVPGYIVIRLPDAEHSFAEGYFYAETSK